MKLSDFLQQYIDEHDISGRELARRCGLSSQTIFNIIKGTTKDGRLIRIDSETLVKIANGTGNTAARFSTINGVYYVSIPGMDDDMEAPSFGTDPADLSIYLEELRTNPEMRILLENCRGMTKEQINGIVQMIQGFKK